MLIDDKLSRNMTDSFSVHHMTVVISFASDELVIGCPTNQLRFSSCFVSLAGKFIDILYFSWRYKYRII